MLFKLIQSCDPSAFFLGLSTEPEEMGRLFEKAGISQGDYLMVSAPYPKVPEMLAAGDIGLLIREANIVNEYACPTKFAEYLAAGLHVVATPAVRDMADLLRKEPVGTLIDDLGNTAVIKDALKNAVIQAKSVEARMTSSMGAAKRHFDWEIYVPRIKKWYFQLLQN